MHMDAHGGHRIKQCRVTARGLQRNMWYRAWRPCLVTCLAPTAC